MKGTFYFDSQTQKYIVSVVSHGVLVNKFEYNNVNEALNRVDLYKNCGVWKWTYDSDVKAAV